ncbi:HesA/MoeB/ThiF family protein [Parachitinimonas caeni]|uniref:Molybdopterin-synthase adenylyltransferase MoeB n=1 Tax=Parachitinimonas caeni TaxID=3031301 RepID=A0ABT7DYI5_9NEIS|nr:molybdopterin-synthase adenylyltransferase MoeB [Parachitinimonas caeni]MDK2124210.1 molybdopterin-synthase adenylyltransferase MoeB [Parachitinimonas caeni]
MSVCELPDFSDESLLRYSRHILLPEVGIEGQQAIGAAHVLVVGMGGLGSPVAMYLAAAGVGRMTICDDDTVELTNLQRQIAHHQADLGRLKVESAAAEIARLNPEVQVEALARRVSDEPLQALVAAADVVVDCCDNFPTRHALNAACARMAKPLVSGAAVRFDGQLSVFDLRHAESPCYHCLFPDDGGEANDGPCATFGVFAPLVGIIGSMQAAEALKLLAGIGESPVGRLLTLDARSMQWRSLKFKRDPDCPVCLQRP